MIDRKYIYEVIIFLHRTLHPNWFSGSGSLVGGYVISVIGSTALTFRYFGVAAAVAGLLLFLYEFGYQKGWKSVFQSNQKEKERKIEHIKENKDNIILISEPLIKSKDAIIVKAKSNSSWQLKIHKDIS